MLTLKHIGMACIVFASLLIWLQHSQRMAERRIADLDLAWNEIDFHPTPTAGCTIDHSAGEALKTFVVKRSAAHFDAAVARSRSIAVMASAAVCLSACLLVSALLHKIGIVSGTLYTV